MDLISQQAALFHRHQLLVAPREAYATLCYCVGPSVRPSVRPSVARYYSIKAAEYAVKQSTPNNSPETVVFSQQRFSRNSYGFNTNIGAKHTLSMINSQYSTIIYSCLSESHRERSHGVDNVQSNPHFRQRALPRLMQIRLV